MAKLTVSIKTIPKGSWMVWFITSQAGYTQNFRLYDEAREYQTGSRTSMDMLNPTPYMGYQQVAGNNLRLDVDVPSSTELKVSSSETPLIAKDFGYITGYSAVYTFEDSIDDDFNDLVVSIVTFKKY